MELQEILENAKSRQGHSLWDMSHQSAVLVVFLRDFGCSFCRETVAELGRLRRPLEQNGIRLAFVHMGSPEDGDAFMERYGASGVDHFSDPDKRLYEAFELRKGSWLRLLSPGVVLRALLAIRHYGYAIQKNPTQMPGVFLLHNGRIEKEYRHRLPSDQPDYLTLADCDLCDTESAVATGKFSAAD